MEIKTRQPEVHLFSSPTFPTKNIGLAVSAWGASSDEFYTTSSQMSIMESFDLAEKGIKAFHRTALEYANFVFVIKNVSRAFQQQITRTRHASFSIQSMRIVTKKGFATEGRYTMPPSLTADQKEMYHTYMLACEASYQHALDTGMNPEDARGMLPLNIHSDISMCINLNALYHMLQQRFCVLTQWEFRQVAVLIKGIMNKEYGPMFSDPMEAPCIKARKCPLREEYCGIPVWKLDHDERMKTYSTWTPGDKK